MFKNLKKRIELLDDKWRYLAEWHSEGSNAVLEFYLKVLPRAADAEKCNIFIHIPSKKDVWLRLGTGEKEKEINLFEDADSIVSEVITTGKARIISGRHRVERHQETSNGPDAVGDRDMLCVPLKSLDGKEIVGAVQLFDKRGSSTFDDLDRESVEEVAHYLEVRLENIFFNVRPMDLLKIVFDAANMVFVVTFGILVILSLVIAISYLPFHFWSD